MTPVTNNNNKDLCDEENNHGHGHEHEHEIILRSLPTNHSEEEEPDDDGQPFSYGHWRPAWSRSRTMTALLGAAAGAGVGVIVGGGSVVFRAAGAKPSTIITSNKQVANVPGYEQVDVGECVDANSQYYPVITYLGIANVDECATKCNTCVAVDFPTLVGMIHNPGAGNCRCLVSQTFTVPPGLDFSQFDNEGPCQAFKNGITGTFTGTGPINGTIPYPGETCYKVGGGGGSKAGKTSKAPKSG